MEFQSHWARSKKLATATHTLFQDVQDRLEHASSSPSPSGEGAGPKRGVVDYTGARQGLEARENGLRAEEERVWSECDRRERRWNLTIHLNQLEPDVEKVTYLLCIS